MNEEDKKKERKKKKKKEPPFTFQSTNNLYPNHVLGLWDLQTFSTKISCKLR